MQWGGPVGALAPGIAKMRKKGYPKHYYNTTYNPYDDYSSQTPYDIYFHQSEQNKSYDDFKKAMKQAAQDMETQKSKAAESILQTKVPKIMASPDLEKEFDSLIEGMLENIHAKEASGEISATQSITLVELVRARVVGAERVGGFDDGFAENACNCTGCKANRVIRKKSEQAFNAKYQEETSPPYEEEGWQSSQKCW